MEPKGLPLTRGTFRFIPESRVLRYLRRDLGPKGKDLVAYYIPAADRICIGKWVNRMAGTVHECFSYRREEEVGPLDLDGVRYYLSPRRNDHLMEMKEALRQKQRDGARKQLDQVEEGRDRARHRRIIQVGYGD
jgi:hypothetical protein